ncbi:hypothetical protein LTR17_003008 [Elasticomyces elasticus]|nr:hypothetical protein LTR17_003008 [Elasticomyces elasticus]
MSNDREKKRMRLTEEDQPEQEEFNEEMSSKQEKAARKAERKMKRAKKAMRKVFGISELREMIILHLPLRQLLLSRLVSRDFAATIDTVKVRQALWLEPVSSQRLKWKYHPDQISKARVARGIIDHGNWVDGSEVSAADGPHPIMNPFIPVEREHGGWNGSTDRAGLIRYNSSMHAYSQPPFVQYLFSDARRVRGELQQESMNYVRMLATHPPVAALEGYDDHVCIMDLDDERGVRIGALFDELAVGADVFYCQREVKWQQLKLERQQEKIDNLKELAKRILKGEEKWASRHEDDKDELTRMSSEWEDTPDYECILEGSEKWQVLARGTDEITGWEMLAIFEASSEKAVYGDRAAKPPGESESPKKAKAPKQAERRILSEEMVVNSDEE